MAAKSNRILPPAELSPLASSMLTLAQEADGEFASAIRALATTALQEREQSARQIVRRITRKTTSKVVQPDGDQVAPLLVVQAQPYRSLRDIVASQISNNLTVPPFLYQSVHDWRRFEGEVSFRVPVSRGAKVTYADVPNPDLDTRRDREAARWHNKLRPLGILSTYGVEWSRQTIVRDIWQNFYDGHGQTLEGVQIKVGRKTQESPYTVTIEGGAEYPQHLLIDIGGTSKAKSMETAGHFGEGAKVVALLLLRDEQASRVVYSSANWSMQFSLESQQGSDAQMLSATLRSCPRRSGNRLEIEVDDPFFVYLLIKGINSFRHPWNPDMQNPTYCGPLGGFKYVPGQMGKVYVGGQCLSVDEEHENGEGAVVSPNDSGTYPELILWLNKKTPEFSADRDRGTLNHRQIGSRVLSPIVMSMTNKDLTDILLKFQSQWPTHGVESGNEDTCALGQLLGDRPITDNANSFMEVLLQEASSRRLKIPFPANCIALRDDTSGDVSLHEQEFLRRRGVHLYSPGMAKLGMQVYDDHFLRRNVGTIVPASRNNAIKVGAMREAVRGILEQVHSHSHLAHVIMTTAMKGTLPLMRQVLLFDAPRGTIFDNRDTIYIGRNLYWSRVAFESASFEKAVETCARMILLHEGSEKSEISSYAITDFIELVLDSISSPEHRAKITMLRRIWDGV